MAANELDSRAVAHGQIVKERRLDLGLNRPAFVSEMAKHGQDITPDYLNKLERGTAPLSRASLEVREAIRLVLGYTREQWQESTGLYTPPSGRPDLVIERSDGTRVEVEVKAQPSRRALPEELEDMIRIRAEQAPELQDERWQQYLAGQRFSTGSVSAERWWRLFLLLKSEGIEPGGN